MRRTLSLLVLVGLITLAPASSANAGGWDSLVFPDDHYLVGEVATTTQWFFAGELRGAGPLEGGRSGSSPASRGAGPSMGASITRTSCLEVPRTGDSA